MKRLPVRPMVAVALAAGLVVVPVAAATPARAATPAPAAATAAAAAGLPADGPPALYQAEPSLPAAAGWPGPGSDAFPQTSGTGRLDDGGFFWTDWLYDDHGATGAGAGQPAITAGTPSFGTYTYPSGPADNNGADIFTAAVYRGSRYTYWRVDFTTLASPTVPIAEWTFDRNHDATSDGSTWPANAGVSSPGIDTALVMSSRGAQLIDVTTGKLEGTYPVTVSVAAGSFVTRIPDSALDPAGTWKIRLAAGLADSAGTGFAAPEGALPGEANVYNVTFRTNAQEPVSDDFWRDMAQAEALTQGSVSEFYATLDWADLAARKTTPQQMPTGWSDRWYVSTLDEGEGVNSGVATIDSGDEFLGPVQPYAVYVPTRYTGKTAYPLTFLLHSSTQNENQYGATTPKFVQEACQDRHSICVTTLGRGPEGNYWDTAELDFWQVWHDVAMHYRLDPTRTIVAGYSMGGTGANQLAMEHPDLFARSITLAGGVGQVPQEVNLRWVPTYLEGAVADELVPITQEYGEADTLSGYGYQYRWLVYPLADHVTLELEDGFSDAAAYMGDASVVTSPGEVNFAWNPQNFAAGGGNGESVGTAGSLPSTQVPKWGVGTTGAYWLRGLSARDSSDLATIAADSTANPDPAVTPVTTHQVLAPGDPTPALATTESWVLGATPAKGDVISLELTNVAGLTILATGAGGAGFHPGDPGVLKVQTDGPVTIRIGRTTLNLPTGTTDVSFFA